MSPGDGPVRWKAEEIQLLKHLAQQGGDRNPVVATSGELGELLGVSQQAADRYLVRLAEHGLVTRALAARRQRLQLTPEALDLLRTEYHGYRRIFEGPGRLAFRGTVASGLGEGRYYLMQPGYLVQFSERLGYTPYPGTLNLKLPADGMARIQGLKGWQGIRIDGFAASGRTFGGATCYRARLAGRPSHLIVPDRTHHKDVVEFIAPERLRDSLSLTDGDELAVELEESSVTASVARTIAKDRRPSPAGPEAASRYVNLWREPEAIGPERVSAFVAILRTRGCYWADGKGCSMCGYAKDTLGRSATPSELDAQLSAILRQYHDEPYVKFYTSGSFLDDREVDPTSRAKIVGAFAGRARQLLFETLPEFVTEGNVGPLRDAFPGTLEIALGLESSDPVVLGKFVTKGSPPDDYFAAFDRGRQLGARIKAYLLLKPPYLTESEAIEDVVRSVRETASRVDAISINPVHIQNGTVVEHLFRRGRYRPPWLWSLVEAISRGAEVRGSARLVTFPTAGGLARGPHNCGKCDRTVLDALETASLDQRFDGLAVLDCACKGRYATLRALEPLGVEA